MEYNYNAPLSHRIFDSLELPEDIFKNSSHIEIVSNCCAMVDGCKSVLEYNENLIKLNLGKKYVTFNGNCLSIKSLALEQAVVEGIIVSVEFG
ncbi:MAG: YabP/YqfC family sporulation protein [Ruminococcus sp.]|nr:YabP/YqfC family sporulation protein [Candidatus Copronaster equi]